MAIIEYADFECAFCAQFAQETWPGLKQKYVDTGQVLAAFRHMPLPKHQHAKRAAISATCAGKQGRFWEMHDRLFQRQGALDQSIGPALARGLGLNEDEFNECSRRANEEVERDAALAKTLGISATPSFLIGRVAADDTVGAGHLLVGAHPLESIAAVIDTMLAGTQ